jgi:hypothetical protein
MTRRPTGHWVVMGLFAAVGINAMAEVLDGLGGQSSSGMLLVAALQTVTAVLAFLSVNAIWRHAAWSTAVISAWGIVSAVMIVLLEPILGLGREARSGLITGALVILAVAACSAWYVRRVPSGDAH